MQTPELIYLMVELGAKPDDAKRACRSCEAERIRDGYNKCGRCKRYHSVQGNYDNMCDDCVATVLTHFPNEPYVPEIKAALNKWKNKP
jgi:hypothetical protein